MEITVAMPKVSQTKIARRRRKLSRKHQRLSTMRRLGARQVREDARKVATQLERLDAKREQVQRRSGKRAPPAKPRYLQHPKVDARRVQHRICELCKETLTSGSRSAYQRARELFDEHAERDGDWEAAGEALARALHIGLMPPWQRAETIREHRRRHRAGRRGHVGLTRSGFPRHSRAARNRNTKPCRCWLCQNADMFDHNGELIDD